MQIKFPLEIYLNESSVLRTSSKKVHTNDLHTIGSCTEAHARIPKPAFAEFSGPINLCYPDCQHFTQAHTKNIQSLSDIFKLTRVCVNAQKKQQLSVRKRLCTLKHSKVTETFLSTPSPTHSAIFPPIGSTDTLLNRHTRSCASEGTNYILSLRRHPNTNMHRLSHIKKATILVVCRCISTLSQLKRPRDKYMFLSLRFWLTSIPVL